MARLVRTLVCAYSRGELPTPWLVVFHRFEAAMDRAGLEVKVKLAPLEDLPEEPFEVLVVPPDLTAMAQALNTGPYLLTTTAANAIQAINGLLAKFAEGSDLVADPLDSSAPRIERYRGFLPL